MVLIIDYKAGNIASVSNMISYLGFRSNISSNYKEVELADKIILPGVGSFDFGIESLKNLNLLSTLVKKVEVDKVPVLGICLGMQLFCKNSEEGELPGLGLIDATVKKFSFKDDLKLKIPHMGWNKVLQTKENPLFEKDEESRFYFVHSFYTSLNDKDLQIGETYYGKKFCSAYQKNNLYGVQFHPEKSHKYGMKLLNKFLLI